MNKKTLAIVLFSLMLGLSLVHQYLGVDRGLFSSDPMIFKNPDASEEREEEEEEGESGALQAMKFLSESRNYPGTVTSDDGFTQAFKRSAIAAKRSADVFGTDDSWEFIGPDNRGGRMISIVVHPTNPEVVYSGSASGGLWKLTIKSNTDYKWEYVETGFPVLGVNAIAIDKANPDVMYIGTGEMYAYEYSTGGRVYRTTRGSVGIGILKTEDGGKTWKKSLDWSYKQRRGVQVMQIHPSNSNIVFAGTSEGVFRSKDAGATWEQMDTVKMVVDIKINPKDPAVVYAACGNQNSPGTGIYKSVAGGDKGSWTKLGGGLPTWTGKANLALWESSPNVIYADIANEGHVYKYRESRDVEDLHTGTVGLFRSTDAGASWTQVMKKSYSSKLKKDVVNDISSYGGWFSHHVKLDQRDTSIIFMAGIRFHRSTNGGNTFTKIGNMHADHHAAADHPTNPDIFYITTDGGVYRTLDNGKTFKHVSNGLNTVQFHNGIAVSWQDPNLIIGGTQDNGTWVYTGKTSWSKTSWSSDGAFSAINTQDDKYIYGSGQNLALYRSIQRAKSGTWSKISETSSMNPDKKAAFIAPMVVAPSNPDIMYSGTDKVLKSTDKGKKGTWKAVNGGKPLNGAPLLNLAVSPVNHNVLMGVTAPSYTGYDAHRISPVWGLRTAVFASTDGGDTFKEVTANLPDRYFLDVAGDWKDEKTWYVTLGGYGTSHVFKTKDAGATWTDIGQGLPDLPTSAIVISPFNSDHLYVGNDIGVWASVDAGATWHQLKEGTPNALLVMDMVISPADSTIIVGSHGNGAYKRKLLPATTPTDVEPLAELKTKVGQNYPNPFHASTTIPFSLSEPSFITAQVVDLKGRVVRTLERKQYFTGRFKLHWDGMDERGQPLEPGTYVARIAGSGFAKSVRMNLR